MKLGVMRSYYREPAGNEEVGTLADHMSPYDDQGLNIGSWPEIAADRLITPTAHFFKRSHAEVPSIDVATWSLEVEGLVERPAAYSLHDLTTRFPRRDVTSTLVCAGLRREEFLALGPLPGELPWGADAASTGVWSGIGLAELLRSAGVTGDAGHVEFVGLDRVERHGKRFGFGGSIDLKKALAGDVLLVTHLNGAPLPPAHGFPLRALVPGWIGARSVKWLGKIRILAHPSDNYFQSEAYRVQRKADPAKPLDVTAGSAMTGIPLNAVIVDPKPHAVVPVGNVRVRGWAIGSESRPLRTVEVSSNGGSDWVRATTIAGGGEWTWTFWEALLPLPRGRHVLWARASDEAKTMPASVSDTWNVKGYGNNAWHRVEVAAE
jgi:sulfite oxidase